jgi:hypothetical protein
MKKTLLLVILLLLILIIPNSILSQGVTSSAFNGSITDKAGKPIPSATVIAVHVPTGTKFGTSTNMSGRYNLQNLKAGGPYTVSVSFVGYQSEKKEGVFVALNENLLINFSLAEGSVDLAPVQVTGERSSILNSGRTGAATNVSIEQLERFPTISRSFTDFQKLTPQFNGNSAGGRNNRFNNIQIDGTVYNDLFGLASSGTPGGQANTNPISLDAIQEFKVVISPFDVRFGGFTGGGVNAITRSGTNTFSGSAFYYGRNQDFVGKSPDAAKTKLAEFSEYQMGFRLGGPIIENKLFFFVNGEFTKRKQPLTNVALISKDTLEKFTSIMKSKYGYDPGTYETFTLERPSTKFFARLDYNINDNHRLTLRHNYVDANDDNLPTSATITYFSNNDYKFYSTTNSTVAQLNSTFGSDMTNELTFGYTMIRDKRDIVGKEFPHFYVKVGGTDNQTKYITAGSERYSIANSLDQDIVEITDNFTWSLGDHLVTIGTHNEIFSFANLYIRDYDGYYEFSNLSDLENGKASRYSYSFSVPPLDPRLKAKFQAIQLGGYIQDEWTVMPTLKISGGIRVDVPTFPDKPSYNYKFDSTFGYMNVGTNKVPSGNMLFSPRIGFNYDVNGDKSTQIRGGIGIFSGKVPYVWLSNQYSNTGVEFGRLDYTASSGKWFNFPFTDPLNPMLIQGGTKTAAPTSEIDITSPDFKFPQISRIDIAIDQKLPFGFIGTFEGIFSSTINDVLYQDINAVQRGTLAGDGRPVYGLKKNSAFTNAIYVSNTDQGSQWSLTAQLQRELLDGLFASAAYTYGQSKDINSLTSSQALSNWRYNPVSDPNNPKLGRSNYDLGGRIFAAVSYRYEYLENWATTVSLSYEGVSGSPFTYIYDGDINKDGTTSNDPIYIPKDQNDIVLVDVKNSSGAVTLSAAQQWVLLDAYINNDDFLKDHRGEIMDRNGARAPFSHTVNLKIVQNIPLFKTHNIELSLDILNFLNLLNGDWGWVKYVTNNTDPLIKYVSNQTSSDPTSRPTFNFTRTSTEPLYVASNIVSRWQLQFGIRYSF